MIVILDSDEPEHRIRFIDIGLLPVKPVVELLLWHVSSGLRYGDTSVPFVHAVVEKSGWYTEEHLTPIADLWEQVSEHTCSVRRCRDKEIIALHTRELPYDVLMHERKKIEIRAWHPGEHPCGCALVELWALAERHRSHGPIAAEGPAR